jgi:hypothetical protein
MVVPVILELWTHQVFYSLVLPLNRELAAEEV